MGLELGNLWSQMRLRKVDHLEPGAVVRGNPWISNSGSIRIGREFHFSSSPAPSHLVVGSGATLRIGDRVMISHGAAIACTLGVSIGDDARIGPFVVLMDSDFHAADRSTGGESTPIVIGRNVSIGSRVTVLRGSTIGDGATVRAGSVVSGSVPAGTTVAGVPARPVGDGLSEHQNEADLLGVIRAVFGLASNPSSSDGPDTIAQWDSLGALRLLLAIEEAFRVTLSEEVFRSVRSIAQLAEAVEVARGR